MALVRCGECGKKVSDKASACPNCGAPVPADHGIEPLATVNGDSGNSSAENDAERPAWGWKKIGCFGFLGLFAAVTIGNVVQMVFYPDEYAARMEQYAAEERAADEAREAEISDEAAAKAQVSAEDFAERRKGFHCLSGWDGSNRSMVEQVKAMLREPGSFEHVETIIYGNDSGEHGTWMTYRARNGFGGTNVERVYARVDHESCEARVLPDAPGSG